MSLSATREVRRGRIITSDDLLSSVQCEDFFSTLKGEERKWLIALIIRDISHFRSCIKESNHPFSPFSTVSTLSSFSLLLSFYSPPTSHKNYSMMIKKLRARHLALQWRPVFIMGWGLGRHDICRDRLHKSLCSILRKVRSRWLNLHILRNHLCHFY